MPLGGLGEIGRNMNVIEYNGHILLIDCGVLFPEEEQPGVDLILPDFNYIKDRLDKVDALVLTHGHEDHIGGVPYLLKMRPDIPLIGSKLTLGFVEAKCHRDAQDHRRQLLEPRAPRAAGGGRRPQVWPQSRVRRPFDGAQHGHRRRSGLPAPA